MDETGSLQQARESPASLGRQGARTNAQVPRIRTQAHYHHIPWIHTRPLSPCRFKQVVRTGTPGTTWPFSLVLKPQFCVTL